MARSPAHHSLRPQTDWPSIRALIPPTKDVGTVDELTLEEEIAAEQYHREQQHQSQLAREWHQQEQRQAEQQAAEHQRQLRLVRQTRQKDAQVEEIFQWLEQTIAGPVSPIGREDIKPEVDNQNSLTDSAHHWSPSKSARIMPWSEDMAATLPHDPEPKPALKKKPANPPELLPAQTMLIRRPPDSIPCLAVTKTLTLTSSHPTPSNVKAPEQKPFDVFQKIYQALYQGQTSWFKSHHLAKMHNLKQVKQYALNKPQSRTATALKLTRIFLNTHDSASLFTDVYLAAFENSLFSTARLTQSVFFSHKALQNHLRHQPQSLLQQAVLSYVGKETSRKAKIYQCLQSLLAEPTTYFRAQRHHP